MSYDGSACILAAYKTDKCASCDGFCQHRIALHGLDGNSGRVGSAGMPADYRHLTLANSLARTDQSEIYRILGAYVATFKRQMQGGERAKSLYLWSESPGTGKTTTASALLNEWIACEYMVAIMAGEYPPQSSAYFLDVTEMQTQYNLATMTKDEKGLDRIGAMIKRVQNANFSVLDDIGTRSSTEAFTAYIHAVINHRTANGLPTVFTSNLPIAEMERIFDARIYDRMRDQCAEIHFGGESKRGRR